MCYETDGTRTSERSLGSDLVLTCTAAVRQCLLIVIYGVLSAASCDDAARLKLMTVTSDKCWRDGQTQAIHSASDKEVSIGSQQIALGSARHAATNKIVRRKRNPTAY
jgi:hypothetical protein